MASAAWSLRLVCSSCRSQRPTQNLGPKVFVAWKSVSAVVKDVDLDDAGPDKPSKFPEFAKRRTAMRKWRRQPAEGITYKMLRQSPGARGSVQELRRSVYNAMKDGDMINMRRNLQDQVYKMRKIKRVEKDSFWDEDEVDNDLITNDDTDTFDENDMTDLAHAKLEEIREQRAYARLIIWDMPLLSKLARPFEPPTMEQSLRFRYTTYMGEFHPAEKKVVVEFSPSDFGLTNVQQEKMIKLAGARYNPEKDTIKMSCESFEHQAQNKRYLAETVQKLLDDSKDPTDTFEDVPFDFRHHKMKVKAKFPPEWRISPERTQEIEEYRQEIKLLEDRKIADGTLIDGNEAILKAIEDREKAKFSWAEEPSSKVLAAVPLSRKTRPTPRRY